MTKKSQKTSLAKNARPQPAQLESIQRLAERGELREARRRLARVRTDFPDFRPALALAWKIEDIAGARTAAAARAWDWVRASPNSTAALEALRDSAFAAGLKALGAQTAMRLEDPDASPPDMPPHTTPLGPITFEQSVACDLSRLYLAEFDWDAALAVLRGVDHPSARNNQAIALFSRGDIAAAAAELEANWQRHPDNLFALERIVRLRLWRGGRDAAAGLRAPLTSGQGRRPEDALARLSGLLLLNDWSGADDAWKAASDAEFWATASPILASLFHYQGAIAALRAGHRDASTTRLRLALEADPEFEAAHELSAYLAFPENDGGGDDVAIGELGAWIPAGWLQEVEAMRGLAEAASTAAFDAVLDRCDAHPDYLGLAAELGGKVPRFLAMAILKRRASRGDGAAAAELRSLLARPCGPDEVRNKLLAWMSENGLTNREDTIDMLVRGQTQKIQPRSFSVTGEAKASGLSAAGDALNERVHEALSQNKLDQALALALELRQMCPEVPMTHANLASIKLALGHPQDEVEDLLGQALALDPHYIFGHCGMARCLIRRGKIEAAKAMMPDMLGREEYHFSEWRAVLETQRELAIAQGETGAAAAIDASLRDIAERFG